MLWTLTIKLIRREGNGGKNRARKEGRIEGGRMTEQRSGDGRKGGRRKEGERKGKGQIKFLFMVAQLINSDKIQTWAVRKLRVHFLL